MAQTRLGGGRVHHAMRTVGVIRRAIDMMCERALSRRTKGELLADKQLDGYFRWLVGGDTLPVQKPDPAALNWVMQQAGVVAPQALFVGDSRSDVLAAKAAGVPVVAVSYGYNHGQPIAAENPDLLVDSLDALI